MNSSPLRRAVRTVAAALLGAALTSVIPAVPALAQAGGGQGGPGRAMGQILLQLTPPLTDAQKTKIKAMREAMVKKNEGVTDREVRRANAKAFYDAINGVLNPKQQADFKSKMEALRAKYRAEHPDAQAPH